MLFISKPHHGVRYVAQPGKGPRLIWYIVPRHTTAGPAKIDPRNVPRTIRKQGYRALWRQRAGAVAAFALLAFELGGARRGRLDDWSMVRRPCHRRRSHRGVARGRSVCHLQDGGEQ
jgi:hypothetical protein